MSRQSPSVCAILAITSNTAFLKILDVPNLIRASDLLVESFPSDTIHIALKSSDFDDVRSLFGKRTGQIEFAPCESFEPKFLAKALEPLWVKSESVLIHDASRPFVDHEQLERVLAAFGNDIDAVRPAMPFTETLKILTADAVIKETLDRSSVLRISTPELIRTSKIDINGSDSGWFLPLKKGAKIIHVEGDPSGLRINSQEDAALMELQHD